MLYTLFLFFFLIVSCSTAQGQLEADADAVRPEGSEGGTIAWAETADRTLTQGEQGEASPPELQGSEEAASSDGQGLPMATPESALQTESTHSQETGAAQTSDAVKETTVLSPSAEADAEDQPRGLVSKEEQVWEEDGIREQFCAGYTRVVFTEILGEEGYKYSFIQNPPRLVVDIREPAREVWFNRLPLRGEAFQGIRVGRYPDKIRFVLDLREDGLPEPIVEATDTDLIVLAGLVPSSEGSPDPAGGRAEVPDQAVQAEDPGGAHVAAATEDPDQPLAPMGGPEVPAAAAEEWKPVGVRGIDFRQTETTSDVVVATDGSVPFDVQEKDDSIVVVLPGAQIPEHLQRPLDTQAFPSAILSVQPEQVGSGPTGKVQFLIRLREKRPYNVLEEEKGIRISVLLPERPPEMPLLPPPALPETEGLVQVQEKAAPEIELGKPEEKAEIEAAPAPKAAPPAVTPVKKVSRAPSAQLAAQQYRGKKVSLDFKDADIQNVLRLIAEVSGQNIVISEAVKGKATIRLLNVPWDMALDVILKTYGLDKEELGPNILRVAPYAQLKKEREEALKADEALEKAEILQTRVVPVNYAKAKDLESLLGKLKSKRPDATILVDTRTNSLILKDLAQNVGDMLELVKSLDTQTPQVLIEAKIVELDVNFERELGIQWGTMYQAGPVTGNPTGLNFPNTASVGGVVDNVSQTTVRGIPNPVVNLPAAVDNTAGGALGISLASITKSFQLDAQLSALEKRQHARVLSSPRVATLNNQEARINQGQEVPYQTTSDEGTKTEFKEAVLALSVTPQITFDRSIIMIITVTNDTPIRDPTVGFIIGKKEAKTSALVKDGDTAVIGGIYTNNDAETVGGVPWLMDIPVAGYLFKKQGDTNKRTELIIFITPRIIPTQTIGVDEWVEGKKTE